MVPPGETLHDLITGRNWLFEEGNYHIDVSHLSSVVGFARFLDTSYPQLRKAIELAQYGSCLAVQFQYPGDPPFDDFYPAHQHYLKVLANDEGDQGIAYFREKLDSESDEESKPFIAYVVVDLLVRCERLDEALSVAEEHLKNVDESSGFSFAQLCQQADRMDTLRQVTREKGDLVGYTAALLQKGIEAVSA